MKEESKRWMLSAKNDFMSAKINFNNKLYSVCAFLCQQSAEKALKALLLEKEKKVIKVHDLSLLGKRAGLDQDLLGKSDRLSSIYIETRYLDVEEILPHKKFDEKQTREILDIAEEILKWAEKNI